MLTALRRQWGILYVSSMETTETIAEIQIKLDEMAAHASRMLVFAEVCACIGFALAVATAVILIWRWKHE